MNAAVGRQTSRKANLAIAGLLTVFVGGTYYNIISRVTKNDLEEELQRELEQEARKQAAQAQNQAWSLHRHGREANRKKIYL